MLDENLDPLDILKKKVSTLFNRVYAFIIDYIISMFLLMPILINISDKYYEIALFGGTSVVICIQEIIFKKTIGKKILKFEIQSESTDNTASLEVSTMQIIKRNITRFIIPFDYLITIVDKKERRLGDIFARTKVVKVHKSTLNV